MVWSFYSGDVELGTSKEVLFAWWGSNAPPTGHLLSEGQDINTIVCHPLEENTLISEQATGWMGYLLRQQPVMVADIYGTHGNYMYYDSTNVHVRICIYIYIASYCSTCLY